VAVYQRALKLLYVDDLLEAVKQEFATSQYKAKQYDYPKFEASFKRLLAEAEARADATLRDRSNTRGFQGKKVDPFLRPCPFSVPHCFS
jgi:Signal recognition particle, alpha subunit, N-terminal